MKLIGELRDQQKSVRKKTAIQMEKGNRNQKKIVL